MKNTKAKNIVITILIILLLCCLGFIVWQYIKIQEKDVILSEKPEVQVQENKVEYKNIVETAIEKHDVKTSEEFACMDSDGTVKLDMVLPKININTETVNNINKKIEELAKREQNNYKEINRDGILNISYSYKHIVNKNVLIVYIENEWNTECASGSYELTSYAYDINKDKVLTVKDFDITDDDLKEGIKYYLEDNEDEYREEMLYDCIKNNEYYITDIKDYKIELSFATPYEDIRITYSY